MVDKKLGLFFLSFFAVSPKKNMEYPASHKQAIFSVDMGCDGGGWTGWDGWDGYLGKPSMSVAAQLTNGVA